MNTASRNIQIRRASLGDSVHAGLTISLPVPPKPELPEQQPPDMPVKVVLAYDDDIALHAAMGVYRGVVGRLTAEFEFRDFWWRFDALAKPALFELAVGVAAEADLVFCCPGNPQMLPRLVQDWIRQWLTRRTQPDGALVLLLPVSAGNPPSPTLLERDLRETARAGGVAFFATNYLADHSQPPASSPAQPPNVFGEDLDVVRAVEHGAGVQHWGINE